MSRTWFIIFMKTDVNILDREVSVMNRNHRQYTMNYGRNKLIFSTFYGKIYYFNNEETMRKSLLASLLSGCNRTYMNEHADIYNK